MISCTSSWDLHTFSRPKYNISEIKKIQEKMLWNHWFSNIAFWIKYHLHGLLRMWWVKMSPVLTVLNLVIEIWPAFRIQNEYLEMKFLELFYFKMFLIKFCGHKVWRLYGSMYFTEKENCTVMPHSLHSFPASVRLMSLTRHSPLTYCVL